MAEIIFLTVGQHARARRLARLLTMAEDEDIEIESAEGGTHQIPLLGAPGSICGRR